MNERIVALHDVLVLRHEEFGWHCEREGRPLFIAKGQIALGFPIPSIGTRGTVQVRELAIRALAPVGSNLRE